MTPFFEKPDKVLQWLRAKGYTGTINDALMKYCQDNSSLTQGTLFDHLNNALGRAGYTGTLNDRLNTMFISKTGVTNRKDAERKLFADNTLGLFTNGNDSFTKLLLHIDSDFTDSSSNNYTPTVTGATIDGSNKKFGAGSGGFTQASSHNVTYPDSSDWFLGTGDFTIDCWARLAATATGYTVFEQAVDANNRVRLIVSDTSIQFQVTSATVELANYIATIASTGTVSFHHFAVVRTGTTTLKIFYDGVDTGASVTTAISTNSLPDLASSLMIGGPSGDAGAFFGGNIDEFRWSKGIARWTSNFTPPTQAYS